MSDNKQKSVFSRIASSFKRLFKSLFAFGSKKDPLMDEDLILSPRELAFENFKRNKLAMFGLGLFVVMTLTILIGSALTPVDYAQTEATLRNIAPGRNFLKYPKQLVEDGVRDVSSGVSFSVGVSEKGDTYFWGKGESSLTIEDIPEEVQNANIVDIAAGDRHVVALSETGELFAWGLNSFSQGEIPVNISNMMGLRKPVKVIAGDLYSAVLTDTGEIFPWGSTLSTNLEVVPNEVQGRIVDAKASSFNILLLLDDNTVATIGQRGSELAQVPEELTNGSIKAESIAVSERNGMVLDEHGEIHTWGSNDTFNLTAVPEGIETSSIVAIEAGRFHFSAVTEQGEVISWGSDRYGQSTTPKKLDGKKVVDIKSDFFQNYALTEEGDLIPWGNKGFLLGSDDLGRDIATRLLHGGRITMFIGAIAVIISTVIGVTVGLIAGFYGGFIDNFLMRIAEIVNSFPFLPLAITLSTIFSGKLDQSQRLAMIMVILGVINWPGLARLVRGLILSEREKDFVLAARAVGLSNRSIIIKHILPSVVNIIIVNMTLAYAGSLLTESGLSFLGFGVELPQPSWGNMLTGSQATHVIEHYWWRWILPAFMVLLAALSVNLIGDGLRDALDPKSSEK